MTFVTPCVIVGDRSLTSLIAHELTHSWTGNLVTNENWCHFWLNEGNTVFVERKIIGRLYGEPLRHFNAYVGYHSGLSATVNEQFNPTHPYTSLVLSDMSHTDPDDSFSRVPYEKGSAFLMYLEQQMGGAEAMDGFLRAYVDKFAHQSITSEVWLAFFKQHFADRKDKLDKIDFDTWMHSPGMPPNDPIFDNQLVLVCDAFVKEWTTNPMNITSSDSYDKLSTVQKIYALIALRRHSGTMSIETMKHMCKLYKFDDVRNSDIEFDWLRLCVKARWTDKMSSAIKFGCEKARLRYRPIFRDLYDWPEAREQTIEAFKKHRNNIHEITAKVVAKDLHLVDT